MKLTHHFQYGYFFAPATAGAPQTLSDDDERISHNVLIKAFLLEKFLIGTVLPR